MLRNRIYYFLKPYVPWRLRMGVRRWLARWQLEKNRATWPINPAAGMRPVDWPGWPNGEKFAFVLSHDVEGPEGLANVRRLAELEMKLGFRSVFNFIPEGSYAVPRELREWLIENGFEVGVHDLRHDGRLFASASGFETKAQRINVHLREWGAGGFRSGFMMRNLDWLHRLDVRYDASTFDTDPFEAQSDGTASIFPFWMSAGEDHPFRKLEPVPNNLGGYVELPYTLPQDSTLFLVLREQSPRIWTEKLDWIARCGGMALVNVHPDYVQFEGDAPSPRKFPISHYSELLKHARATHDSTFWQPLPGELADYVARIKPSPPFRRKRVCMVTHSFYENDNRVMRYAEALAARGDHVDVLSLRRSEAVPEYQQLDGVHVHRILTREGKQERSKFEYLRSWMRFLWRSGWWLYRQHRKDAFDLIHVHNMPDFLAFAALYPRLRGAKVILDIHDIVPEFYASKFGASRRTLSLTVLEGAERISARIVDHVIISNHLWRDKYTARTGTSNRCSVFINNVNTKVFVRQPPRAPDGRRIVIFPGGLQWHQGLDIAIAAFKQVVEAIPNAEFHIYGDGNKKPELIRQAQKLGLGRCVRFFEPVSVKQVARIMAAADLGVVPKRADSFGNQAYSTKIMEFMSVGVPAVISDTDIDKFYFDDSVVRFFRSGNEGELASAIIAMLSDEVARQRQIEKALKYAQSNSWEVRKSDYFAIVDRLIGGVTIPAGQMGRAVRAERALQEVVH